MKTQTTSWIAPDGANWVFVGNGSSLSGLKVTLNTTTGKPYLQPTVSPDEVPTRLPSSLPTT